MTRITSRVKIPIGLQCNAKCVFCYYWDNLNDKNPSINDIKTKLNYARNRGILDVDFSGGEPTVRPDLSKIISYAQAIGYRNISIITNGIKLSDVNLLQELISAGLNDILCSIQGDSAKCHEQLVRVPGSFDKVLNTIQNCVELGVRVRTNTTITKYNYHRLPEIAKLLKSYNIRTVNFIMFNSWCSAKKLTDDLAFKYSHASPYIKEAVDHLTHIPKLTVRYIPLCFMEGYETFVCNLLKKKFDSDEWDDAIKIKLLSPIPSEKPYSNSFTKVYKDLLQFPTLKDLFKFRTRAYYHDREIARMRSDYKHSKTCLNCKYYKICDGLSTEYHNTFGFDELQPVYGTQCKNPCLLSN